MAVVTTAVHERLAERFSTVVCNVSPSALYGPRPRLGVLVKLWRYLGAWIRLPLLRLGGATILYMPLDSRLGILFNLVTLALGRVLGMRFVLHHHVANYVVEPSRPMRWVNAVTGPRDIQIFVCRNLLERFRRAYPARADMRHVSNSAFIEVDGATPPAREPGRGLVLGMLAGLTMEKGLGVVLDLLDAAIRDGLDVRMVIAGPVHQAAARARLDVALAAHPNRLDYRGSVHGAEKTRFFHEVDLFVFPTLYRLEAEPLVVIEALSHGRPVVASDRGCIAEILGAGGGVVVGDDEDFVARAIAECRHHLADPAALAAARTAARARADERAAEARQDGRRLLDDLAGV